MACRVFDKVFKGFSGQLIGTFTIPIGDIMVAQREDYEKNCQMLDKLIKDLEALEIQERRIRDRRRALERRISNLIEIEPVEEPAAPEQVPKAENINDRDGNVINVGDHVAFLTRGAYPSRRGIVQSVNKNCLGCVTRPLRSEATQRGLSTHCLLLVAERSSRHSPNPAWFVLLDSAITY